MANTLQYKKYTGLFSQISWFPNL